METIFLIAVDRDGLHFRFLEIILLKKPGMNKENVEDAIRKASTEFCKTKEGKEIYEYNCNNFNYGDFVDHVPNSICEKYGIKKVDSHITANEVDFNSHLVDASELEQEV